VAVYRHDRRRRGTLVLVVITSLTLATLDERGSGIIDGVRTATRDVVAPVQDLADVAVQPTADFFDGLGRSGSLEAENARLRHRLEAARDALVRAKEDRARVKQLEEIADVPQVPAADTVTARVLSRSVGKLEKTFEIDRGRDDGLQVGMAVVVGKGTLVGQVIAASRSRATVRRIDDRRFVVGVRVVGKDTLGPLGILEGQSDSNLLRLSFLAGGASVEKDQAVVTAGLDDEPFPPDLPVGLVERATDRGLADPRDGLVRPSVDLDAIDVVRVLLIRVGK
jgi:rod shape-determining protein MreC